MGGCAQTAHGHTLRVAVPLACARCAFQFQVSMKGGILNSLTLQCIVMQPADTVRLRCLGQRLPPNLLHRH